jgi:MFS family permease
LSITGTGSYLAVLIAGSFTGYVSGGYISDWLGRRGNLVAFALLCAASVYAYTQFQFTNAQMLMLGFPLGFAAAGMFGGIGAHLTELFPTRIRANGQGFSYNFGRGIGALSPALIGLLSTRISLANAIGLFTLLANAVVVFSALCLPETRGRALADAEVAARPPLSADPGDPVGEVAAAKSD